MTMIAAMTRTMTTIRTIHPMVFMPSHGTRKAPARQALAI
jgi:hypothetical protein